MTTKQRITHESEVQRQHVRLQLPIRILIRQITCEVFDWSNSGVSFNMKPLNAQNVPVKTGDMINAVLLFDFDSFSLQVPVTCEVRHVQADGMRAGCRFHNMSERNLSILHYLVSAYIAGDLVQVGDMLDVVARQNFTNARKNSAGGDLSIAEQRKRRVRQLINSAILAVLTIGLLTFITMSVYERLYIVKARSAIVAVNENIEGSSSTLVEALIPYTEAVRIARGMPATLGFPGYDTYISAQVLDIVTEDVEFGEARVTIRPNEELPIELLRSPVEVKIDVR